MISCNGASCNTGQLRSDIWKLLPEVNATARTEKTLVQGTDNDPTMSRLSHSFCFPCLWTHHQEAMPKSCLLVFPHAERKRQNNLPFISDVFPLCPCDSSSWFCPLSSPNWFTCVGFLLLWKGCILGPHEVASVSRFAFLACSPTKLWVLWAAWLYTYSSPTCLRHPPPDFSTGKQE